MCEALHVLPHAGGLLDQDSFLIDLIDMVVTEKKAKEAEEQHQAELRRNRPGGKR
jgi:hypothetical protein